MTQSGSTEHVDEAILGAIPDIILRIRRDGLVLDARYPPGVADLASESWGQRNLRDLLPQANLGDALALIGRVLSSGKLETLTIPWADGSSIYEARVARCAADEVVALVRDVTEPERARRELADAQHLFLRIGQMMPVCVYVHDMARAKNVYINRRLQDMLGYPQEQADAMGDFPLPQLLYPEDVARLPELIAQSLSGKDGEVMEFESRARGADGEERWLRNLSTVFSRNENGVPVELLGWIEDVTERKRLEDELRQAQKMEILGQLSGGIAHDFNNVMTSVLCSANLLLDALSDRALRADAQQIIESSLRAASLTKRLLSISRVHQPVRSAVDVTALASNMIPLLGRMLGERHPLRLSTPSEPAFIEADPHELEQGLINLVVNARDALPEGGPIDVLVAVEAEGEPRQVVVSVVDRGVGMTAAVRAKIFRPFFTTKPEGFGTGLGLPYVKRMVESFGGTVAVESAVGAGARFSLRFPASRAPAEPPVSPPQVVAPHGGRVLLVEDDATIRRLARETLVRDGYQVTALESGEAALALDDAEIRAHQILVSDVVLTGVSGPATAELLRRRHPSLRTLLMSGYYDADASGAPDAAAVLQKPFTPRELATAVARALAD